MKQLFLYIVVLSCFTVYSDSITTITDINSWNHGVKEYLGNSPYSLYRIELLSNNTYPKFFVRKPDYAMINDRITTMQFLEKIAKANAYWDFELVNEKDSLIIKTICDRSRKQIKEILVYSQSYYFNDSIPFDKLKGSSFYIADSIKRLLKKGNYSLPLNKVCNYLENDFDLDGKREAVFAVLDTFDKDCGTTLYSSLHFFRINESSIDSLCVMPSDAMVPVSMKEIYLENEKKPYIYCRTTNGFCSSFGYFVYTIENSSAVVKYLAASPTGSGLDYLADEDHNKFFDTWYSFRKLFDFPVKMRYVYRANEFILRNTVVDMENTVLNASSVESALKYAVALKHLSSPASQKNYLIVNTSDLELAFRRICKSKYFPDLTDINTESLDAVEIVIKNSTINSAVAQLKNSDNGIAAEAYLEKRGDTWVIVNVLKK